MVCVLVLGTCAFSRVFAGTDMQSTKSDMKGMTPQLATESDWSLELASGVTWSNVRSGQPNQAYTIVPINLTASLRVDDVSLDNFLGGWLGVSPGLFLP